MTQDEMVRAAEILSDMANNIYEGHGLDREYEDDYILNDLSPVLCAAAIEAKSMRLQIQEDYEEMHDLAEKLRAYALA